MSVSGQNMQRVVQARDHHNATCALGPATEVRINPADLERSGWDDGDVIACLTVVSDPGQNPGFLHVTCPGEGDGAGLEAIEAVGVYA